MAKNDYRRALIMLRGLEKGYSGHARLEKRVMTGTMDFTVSSPVSGEALAAALVGPRGGKTVAKALGTFKPDGRGQMGLLASFDPRNIAGLDLSEVSAAIIARVSESGVQPLLYGWINGSKTVDWQDIQSAVEKLFSVSPRTDGNSAQVSPEASGESPDVRAQQEEEIKNSANGSNAIPLPSESGNSAPLSQSENNTVGNSSNAYPLPSENGNSVPLPQTENGGSNAIPLPSENGNGSLLSQSENDTPDNVPLQSENENPADGSEVRFSPQENDHPAGDASAESSEENVPSPGMPSENAGTPTRAGQLLNLDMNQKWPDDVESLRILFLTLPPFQPFEMDGFVFVRAGMAEETGIDHCAVGIRAENGRVTGVCYAIPMTYTSEPPAGLEDYVWIGDHTRGWWVTVDDLTE